MIATEMRKSQGFIVLSSSHKDSASIVTYATEHTAKTMGIKEPLFSLSFLARRTHIWTYRTWIGYPNTSCQTIYSEFSLSR